MKGGEKKWGKTKVVPVDKVRATLALADNAEADAEAPEEQPAHAGNNYSGAQKSPFLFENIWFNIKT